MKRKYLLMLVLIILGLVVMIAVPQSILYFSGAEFNINIPTPLIVFFAVAICLIILLGVLNIVLYSVRLKQLYNSFKRRDYRAATSHSKFVSYVLPGKFKEKALLYLAVSFLELGEEKKFEENILKLSQKESSNWQYLWLAINSFLKSDLESFTEWQAKIVQNPNQINKDIAIKVLNILHKSTQKDCILQDEDIEIIKTLNSDLVEKQLCIK